VSVSHARKLCSPAVTQPDMSSVPGVVGVRKLVDMLGGVVDPRHVRGIRFQIGTVLAVMVFAVLAGARNFAGDRGPGAGSSRGATGLGWLPHPRGQRLLRRAQRGDDPPYGTRHRR
jgi:hypothetical protein